MADKKPLPEPQTQLTQPAAHSTRPRRGQGHRPSGIPVPLFERGKPLSACAALLHALEEGSLREPFRNGVQRTPRGDAPTHVATLPS